jgi:hypothetical protein
MQYNRELQVIDTEEKAYFLGLLYADGSISIKTDKSCNCVKYRFQISLTDEILIQKISKFFPFLNMSSFDFGKYKESWSKQFSLRKTSRVLVQDLINNGMIERKSEDNSNLLSIPNIDEKLLHHFIRGFFDGDGSINIPKKRPNLRRVEICGSSKSFLLQVKSILESNGVNCPIFRERTLNKINPLYILEWVNFNDVNLLKNYMYKESTIHLDRKKELFESFKLIDKKKDNPICIHCNSFSCQKQGIRTMKHSSMYRYHCTNCGKRFSVPAQVKQGELLETPVVKQDNQQPSLDSNILEGSTTNSRVLPSNVEDSNANKSALLLNFIQ